MTIANSVAAKLFAVLTAVAMALTLAAPAAQAQSADDLANMDTDALIALIMTLLGDDDGMTMSSNSKCSYAWTRNLDMGATGPDVMALQEFLMAEGQSIPAGPTGYFGGQTQAALAGWQAANGVAPAVGFFGPITRGAIADKCAMMPDVDVDIDVDVDEDEDEDEDDDDSSRTLSGNADLETFELDDAEDEDVEEGREDEEIAELDIEFEDGDALVDQIELVFNLKSGQSSDAESDPWDTFETISLWLDGEKIAEENVDDEDDWEGSDDDEITFNNLDLFVPEDEEITLIIGASIQNGLDFDTDDENTWTITLNADAIRFEDADGFVQDDGSADATGVDFDIQEEGAEDELDVRSSSDDPESTTLPLKDDEDTNHVVFAFDLDAEDSDNDIEFDQLIVDFTVSSGTLQDYVDDAILLVDGSEVKTDNETVNAGNVTFTFDSDDFVIERGERVTVEVELEFDSLAPSDEGVTIQGSMTGNATKIDAEGADDLTNTNIDGSATGDTHTMRTTGLIYTTDHDGNNDAPDDSFTLRENSDSTSDDDEGIFTFTFEVMAFEDDAYINDSVASGTDRTDDTSAGFFVTILRNGTVLGNGAATTSLIVSQSSAEQESSGRYRINEGETETFTLKVEVDPSATSGTYEVQFQGVAFNATDADSDSFQQALPTTAFDTEEETI